MNILPRRFMLFRPACKILPNDTTALRRDVVLVNVDAIREIQPYFRGDFAVVLRDGSHVITSRTYRERTRRRFSLV